GLSRYLDALGFNLVGYGCTTCIGNSGPLPEDVSAVVAEKNLVVCSVLSGNRNFEGRIQQQVRANYLASPPLVVAYALAGRMTIDLTTEPIGTDRIGAPVFLRELWPAEREIQETMLTAVTSEMFRTQYSDVFSGHEGWTTYQPGGEVMTIYDAAMKYKEKSVPLIVLAGKEYGSGSSRDWAAKGTLLLGVKAVIAESFERIHRSNLVNMGVLPLQYQAG